MRCSCFSECKDLGGHFFKVKRAARECVRMYVIMTFMLDNLSLKFCNNLVIQSESNLP